MSIEPNPKDLQTAVENHTLAKAKRDKAADSVAHADSHLEAVSVRLDELSDLDARTAKFYATRLADGSDCSKTPLPAVISTAIKERHDLQVRRADLQAAREVLAQDLADTTLSARDAAARVRLAAAPFEVSKADDLVAQIEDHEGELHDLWLRLTALARASEGKTLPSFGLRAQATIRCAPASPQINSRSAATWTGYRDEAVAWRKGLLSGEGASSEV
jgi:hypothetical protein